jgi:predicted nucleotidyltransferase
MIDQNTLQQAVGRIVDATHPKRVILFGSYGRDQATEDSDLDLMVIQPRVENQAATMVYLRQLLGSLGMGVDVLVYSEAEYERRSRVPGTVHYWARREGKTLYEAAS